MAKYIFLDTNIYLHYKPVEQLDLERFGNECVLVVPRVILGEINKHKDTHASDSIRKRARSICRRIHAWDDAKAVSDRLGFEFCIAIPRPDQHNLEPSSSDDQFLSVILDYNAAVDDKLLISNDSNLCLTAKHLGIHVHEIEDKYRLPSAIDPVEQENQRLKQEVDLLKNARPRLEIGLISNQDSRQIEPNPIFRLRKPKEELTDAEINEAMQNIRNKVDEKRRAYSGQPLLYLHASMLSREDIETFHEQLADYPEQYMQYLLAKRDHLKKRIIKFIIGITNVGTSPAQNVDIYLHFPDGFDIYEEEDMPQSPQPPQLPDEPVSKVQRMLGQMSLGINRFNPIVRSRPRVGGNSS